MKASLVEVTVTVHIFVKVPIISRASLAETTVATATRRASLAETTVPTTKEWRSYKGIPSVILNLIEASRLKPAFD